MTVPELKFNLGAVEPQFLRSLSALAADHAVSRFWQKDLSLWPFYETRKGRQPGALNWLDLPQGLAPSISQITALAGKLKELGIQDIVFLAISTSNIAAELVTALGLPTYGVRFHILNRIDPLALKALEQKLDFRRTLFLKASKTGKALETHALLLYLLGRVKAAGIAAPGDHFIAIAEEGSYLAALASEHRFQAILTEPHGFRGRFSGVQHYGLLLGGLCGVDASTILEHIEATRRSCGRSDPLEDNPAAKIAAFLAGAEATGYHRLVFRAPQKLMPLARHFSYLVSSSTCKNESGIIAFLEIHAPTSEILANRCCVCDTTMQGEPPLDPLDPSIPAMRIEIEEIAAIPAKVFQLEVATALACSLLEVNPFEDPDYLDGRDAAMRYLDQISQRQLAAPRPRIVQGCLSLFVEGDLRHEVSSLNLEHALASVFALCAVDGYCTFLNFLWDTPEVKLALSHCAERVISQLLVPAQVVPSPSYLHLLGQVYKGGPRGGVAILLTADSQDRIEVPGAGYTFGDLKLALALGDFDAMNRRRRPIVRLHLASDPAAAMAELQAVVDKALKLYNRAH